MEMFQDVAETKNMIKKQQQNKSNIVRTEEGRRSQM